MLTRTVADSRTVSADIADRSFQYARRALRLARAVLARREGTSTIIIHQYLRSATSIGANVQEAQAAESRRDFVHKLTFAQKETRESLYWLRLLDDGVTIESVRLAGIIEETQALLLIIPKIIVVTKHRDQTRRSS